MAGVGWLWQSQNGDGFFKAGVAGTYTAQDEVVDDPETENQFAGMRATLDGEKRFGDQKQHAFTSNLIVDQNLQQTDDLRVQLAERPGRRHQPEAAMKLGLQLAYDNAPALVDFRTLFPRAARRTILVATCVENGTGPGEEAGPDRSPRPSSSTSGPAAARRARRPDGRFRYVLRDAGSAARVARQPVPPRIDRPFPILE